MCVCDKHTRTNYKFYRLLFSSSSFSFWNAFYAYRKKSYLGQRRARYEKQFRMTHDNKLNPIVIWYVFSRRLSSLMNVLWQYKHTHSKCVRVLCTVYALRQFLLIHRHEHSPLIAHRYTSFGLEHNKYILTLRHTHTNIHDDSTEPKRCKRKAIRSVCATTTIYSLVCYHIVLCFCCCHFIVSKCCCSLDFQTQSNGNGGKERNEKNESLSSALCTLFRYSRSNVNDLS